MKLHTKDQAPKEGGKAAAPQPFQKVPQLVHLSFGATEYITSRVGVQRVNRRSVM